MNNKSSRYDVAILVACFIFSRVLVHYFGVVFGYDALFDYWQYLDVQSLQQNLLNSLWYQHSQPPFFNFMLGSILKISAQQAPFVMHYIFLFISLSNGWLVLKIVKSQVAQGPIPIITALVYLLSPATLLYENELFYTSLISFFLLMTVYAILNFEKSRKPFYAAVLFASLTFLCLTRSMYHLVWLLAINALILFYEKGKPGFKYLFTGALFSILFVGGWYAKNYFIFGKFASSSWLGINFSRIVFHDNPIYDSANIATVHPFYPVAYYKKYISDDYKKYAGLNDRVLLAETKNGSFINMNHAGYIEVSEKYLDASIAYIRKKPARYLKNTFKAFIIFFTPASRYYKLDSNADRIRYYDLVAGGNLSHLAGREEQKKVLSVVAAVPIMLAYALVLFDLMAVSRRKKSISLHHLLILVTIFFLLATSTLLEYGENMRYRYEIQPLFLILVAHALTRKKQAGLLNKM